MIRNSFSFQAWFIGFFEGDGSFVVDNKTNRCFLIINQKDIKVVQFIKNNLKLGSIRQYNGINRWVVSSKYDILKTIEYLNGYLLLDKTNKSLNNFISSFNTYHRLKPGDKDYILYKGPGEFDIKNSWFSGFIDAEGCFNIRIVSLKKKKEEFLNLVPELKNLDHSLIINKNPKSWVSGPNSVIKTETLELLEPMSFRVRLRFVISQKFEKRIFNFLVEEYGGSISTKEKDIYVYSLDSNLRQKKLIDYLSIHPLQSIKHIDFLKFKNTYYQLLSKDHLKITNITRIINWLSRNQ